MPALLFTTQSRFTNAFHLWHVQSSKLSLSLHSSFFSFIARGQCCWRRLGYFLCPCSESILLWMSPALFLSSMQSLNLYMYKSSRAYGLDAPEAFEIDMETLECGNWGLEIRRIHLNSGTLKTSKPSWLSPRSKKTKLIEMCWRLVL